MLMSTKLYLSSLFGDLHSYLVIFIIARGTELISVLSEIKRERRTRDKKGKDNFKFYFKIELIQII